MVYEGIAQESTCKEQPCGHIERVNKLLDRAIVEGRRLIKELRPMVLDGAGIVEAIRHLVASEYCDSSLNVGLELPASFGRLDPMLESAAFRIVQEALTNATRHSQSETVVIKLARIGQKLLLEVRDQGVGFDVDKVPEDRFGLRGMRERARLLGGRVAIDSEPGSGCCLAVELPIPEKAPV